MGETIAMFDMNIALPPTDNRPPIDNKSTADNEPHSDNGAINNHAPDQINNTPTEPHQSAQVSQPSSKPPVHGIPKMRS